MCSLKTLRQEPFLPDGSHERLDLLSLRCREAQDRPCPSRSLRLTESSRTARYAATDPVPMVCCSALNWHDRETAVPMLSRNKLLSRVVLRTCRPAQSSDRSCVDFRPFARRHCAASDGEAIAELVQRHRVQITELGALQRRRRLRSGPADGFGNAARLEAEGQSMLNCDAASRYLLYAADDPTLLDVAAIIALKDHLAACSRCRQEFESQRAVAALLRKRPPDVLSPEFSAALAAPR